MFLHLSVNLFTVGCLPWVHGGAHPQADTPLGRYLPLGRLPPTVDILLECILVKNCISNLADLTDLLIVKMTKMFHDVICKSETWTLQTLATEKRWIIKTKQDINYANKAMILKMFTRKYDDSWRIDCSFLQGKYFNWKSYFLLCMKRTSFNRSCVIEKCTTEKKISQTVPKCIFVLLT